VKRAAPVPPETVVCLIKARAGARPYKLVPRQRAVARRLEAANGSNPPGKWRVEDDVERVGAAKKEGAVGQRRRPAPFETGRRGTSGIHNDIALDAVSAGRAQEKRERPS